MIRTFSSAIASGRAKWTWGDGVALTTVTAFLYFSIRMALRAPMAIEGPAISLSPAMLPLYAGFSFLRMLTAYVMSMAFSLWYGSLAASNRRAEQILLARALLSPSGGHGQHREPQGCAGDLHGADSRPRPAYRLFDSSQALVNMFASSERRSTCRMRMSVEFAFSTSS